MDRGWRILTVRVSFIALAAMCAAGYVVTLSATKGMQVLGVRLRCRFFAKFTLSGNCRLFAALRVTANGLRMTASGAGGLRPN